MKLIILYGLNLCHKSTPYIACMLKHQVLMKKMGSVMSRIFLRQFCHDDENSLHKAAQEEPKDKIENT